MKCEKRVNLVYLVMKGNRYLAKLISDYNKYKRFSKSHRLFSSKDEMMELASNVDPELLQEFVSVLKERYKKMGIDPMSLPEDVLYKDIALVYLATSRKCDPQEERDNCESLADKIVKEMKSVSYSKMHKSFSLMKIADSVWGPIAKRLALAGALVNAAIAKAFDIKDPNKPMQNVVENRPVAVSVANPDLSYITVRNVPENEAELLDIIVRERGKDLLSAYDNVYTAIGKIPESKLTEAEATKLIYNSVKKIYNYLIKHDRELNIEDLTIKVSQKDEPQNMIVGNRYISQGDILNFLAMMLTSKAINDAYIRGNAFEFGFLDHNSKVTNKITNTIYLLVDTQDGKKTYIIELDKIRLANRNEPGIKDGKFATDTQAMTHFYMQFPVGLEKGSVGGIFAPIFEVVASVTIGKSILNTSDAQVQTGTSNRYLKNKRLFSRKKKYNWM